MTSVSAVLCVKSVPVVPVLERGAGYVGLPPRDAAAGAGCVGLLRVKSLLVLSVSVFPCVKSLLVFSVSAVACVKPLRVLSFSVVTCGKPLLELFGLDR
ncbi:hypothetical protein PR002_g10309 [Phytophthora rubi]|uniref:Uncharacterized protein n=1 Tax=Phytophthora rubi TaxID=129364 RepID=A0A6A3ML29_9STRA|nr:hypothetical protein PR002_g10309 [Phytophthora rubi]